jgi:hypothetical protein
MKHQAEPQIHRESHAPRCCVIFSEYHRSCAVQRMRAWSRPALQLRQARLFVGRSANPPTAPAARFARVIPG